MENDSDAVIERLIALADQKVWLSIVRGGLDGATVVREGVVRVAATLQEIRAALTGGYNIVIARVEDDTGAPVARLLSRAEMDDWNGVLRFESRPTFWIDVDDREPPGRRPDDAMLSPLEFAKRLVAELEASLGTSVMFEPDPDADSSWRAQYRPAPIGEQPFSLSSRMHLGSNMRSAFLAWKKDSLDVSYYAPALASNGQPVADLLIPHAGSEYDYSERALRRLGSDLRRHFHGQSEHLVKLGG
jgi:hypothetical protein